MYLKEAVDRLINTISYQRKPTNFDADAIKRIVEYIDDVNKKTIKENELFAKFFAYTIRQNLHHWQDINFTCKQVVKEVNELPLINHIEKLNIDVNAYNMESYFYDTLKLKPVWENKLSLDEMRKNNEDNNEILRKVSKKEALENLKGETLEETISNFELLFNELINKFKNN